MSAYTPPACCELGEYHSLLGCATWQQTADASVACSRHGEALAVAVLQLCTLGYGGGFPKLLSIWHGNFQVSGFCTGTRLNWYYITAVSPSATSAGRGLPSGFWQVAHSCVHIEHLLRTNTCCSERGPLKSDASGGAGFASFRPWKSKYICSPQRKGIFIFCDLVVQRKYIFECSFQDSRQQGHKIVLRHVKLKSH